MFDITRASKEKNTLGAIEPKNETETKVYYESKYIFFEVFFKQFYSSGWSSLCVLALLNHLRWKSLTYLSIQTRTNFIINGDNKFVGVCVLGEEQSHTETERPRQTKQKENKIHWPQSECISNTRTSTHTHKNDDVFGFFFLFGLWWSSPPQNVSNFEHDYQVPGHTRTEKNKKNSQTRT